MLLLLAWRDVIPIPPDGYYHLMAARRILEDGRVPLWDSWQFAPLGRPHLYPPLFHILLALVSLPFGGDLLQGFRIVVALMLPGVLFCIWYLAHTLFGPRRALFAVLLAGWDPMFVLMNLMALPSMLAGGFAALALAALHARRHAPATLLTVLTLYTHPGIGPFLLIALVLLALWDRSYRRAALAVAAVAALAAFPWYVRIWAYGDWRVHPLDQGLYGTFEGWPLPLAKLLWLQCLNLVLVALAIWGMARARWSESRHRLLLCAILGCTPLLLSYGGRFYLHNVPCLALFAAEPLTRLRPLKTWRRETVRLAALALCPTLALIGPGTIVRPGPWPMPSGWTAPLFLGAGGARLLDGGGRLGFLPFHEAKVLAEHIRATSRPDQVLHVAEGRDFALVLGFLADRPIDTGAWEEVIPPGANSRPFQWNARYDPTGYYVGLHRSSIPRDVKRQQVGSAYAGARTNAAKPASVTDSDRDPRSKTR